jgi:hypothetical protein
MKSFDSLRMHVRFARELPAFLRRRLTIDEARERIKNGMAERNANFLRLLRFGVFANPKSPYRPLLRLAGCELGDIEGSIQKKGLEPTLEDLRRAGVYFTFEEYKGRAPVVRGGQVIGITAGDFDNPRTASAYEARTGGTTGGIGTRVTMDIETLESHVPHLMVARDVHAMLGCPMAIWRGTLPDPTGIGIILRSVSWGGVPERWFTPLTRQAYTPAFKYQLATYGIIAVSRALGVRVPYPEPVPIEQAAVIARWARDAVHTHGRCVVGTAISLAVRICIAAHEAGISLSGVTFMSGGEPFTPAKARVVTRSGARLVPHYIAVDAGPIGFACTRPSEEDDLHLLSDRLALIQHDSRPPDSVTSVNAFYYTSLQPTAAKILINVESDDCGIAEQRRCGCPFEALGYAWHLRRIRSFGKITIEGVTLVGSEMTRVLEEVLPMAFGGSPLDYQLVEEEDEKLGLSRLVLLVDPKIDISSPENVVNAVLKALERGSVSADLTQALWRQTHTLQVRRAEPVWTTRGKLLPVRTDGRFTRA